ncbi:MAG: hypothetical protein ACI9CD_000832 [Candidatus Deianiraeaceae bacterium]|jgi:hypothetical protein
MFKTLGLETEFENLMEFERNKPTPRPSNTDL